MAPPAKENKKLNLDQKIEIIKMKKEGKRNCDIAREFEVGESTVRMVYKNSGLIEQTVKTYGGQVFDSHHGGKSTRPQSTMPGVLLSHTWSPRM